MTEVDPEEKQIVIESFTYLIKKNLKKTRGPWATSLTREPHLSKRLDHNVDERRKMILSFL